MATVIDFLKSSPAKALVYSEIDDNAQGGPEIGIGIIAQLPGSTNLVKYGGDKQAEIMKALLSEATASGKDGWRMIRIVSDKGVVTVRRGASPGSILGFNDRLHAAADQAFPGHS